MNEEFLFLICNFLVIPSWLLLIVAPKWRWTMLFLNLCLGALVVLVMGIYIILVNTLTSAFAIQWQAPSLLLIGLVHYLILDLLIGRWEFIDAQKLKIPQRFVTPCLLGTFMLAPIGLFFYLALRKMKREFLINSISLK